MLLLLMLCTSCSSNYKSTRKHLVVSFDQIENVLIGQVKSEVVKSIGEPQSSELIAIRGKQFHSLEYRNIDAYESQRVTVLLDPFTGKVISKTFIPNSGELEESKDYLVNKKYKNMKFATYLKPRCGSHSVSADAILVNIEQGIVINYLKKDSGVLAISWMNDRELSDILEKMKNCSK